MPAVLAVLAFFGVRQYTDIFATAKIARLSIGKGHDVNSLNSVAEVLRPSEDFHARAQLTHIADAYQLKARVVFDRVDGHDSGTLVAGSERTYEINDSGIWFFYYSTSGWPMGVYKVEVNLVNRGNQQTDRQVAHFRISATD